MDLVAWNKDDDDDDEYNTHIDFRNIVSFPDACYSNVDELQTARRQIIVFKFSICLFHFLTHCGFVNCMFLIYTYKSNFT